MYPLSSRSPDPQPLSKSSLTPRAKGLLSQKSDQATSPGPPEAAHLALSRTQRRTEPLLPSCPTRWLSSPASSPASLPPAHTILAVLPENSHSSAPQGHSPRCVPCLKWESHGWLAHSLNYFRSVIKCHLFSTSFILTSPLLISPFLPPCYCSQYHYRICLPMSLSCFASHFLPLEYKPPEHGDICLSYSFSLVPRTVPDMQWTLSKYLLSKRNKGLVSLCGVNRGTIRASWQKLQGDST